MKQFHKEQVGLGIIGDFFKKIGLKSFKTVANIFRKGVKGSRPLKDGEFHVLASNFCGPGTRIDLSEVRNYKPLNRPDEVCKAHDISYLASEKMDDKERQIAIRKADEVMIDALKKMGKLKGTEEFYRQAGLRGIQFKKYLEDMNPKLAKKLLPAKLIGRPELREDIEESGVLNDDEEEKKQKPNKKMAEATKKLAEKQKKRKEQKEKKEKKISVNDIKEMMEGKGDTIKRLVKVSSLLTKYGPKKLYRIAKGLDKNVKPEIRAAAKRELKKLPKKVIDEIKQEMKGEGIAKKLGKIAKKVVKKGKKTVGEFKEGFKGGENSQRIKVQFGGSDNDAEKIEDMIDDGKKVELDISLKQIEKQPKSTLKKWAGWAKKGLLTIAKGAASVLKDVAQTGIQVVKDAAVPIASAALSAYLLSKAKEKNLPGINNSNQEGGSVEKTNNELPQAPGRAGNPLTMNATFLQMPIRRDLQLQSGSGCMCDNIKKMRKMRPSRRF